LITYVDGRIVAYDFVAAPAGNGPVVAFVHGLAASRSSWAKVSALIERAGFGTLRLDLRGHGESAPVDRACSRSDLANDLIGLLDRLSIANVVVVGHSAGGVVAMQSVADHPARVAAMVLVGTASECNEKTASWYRSTADTAQREGGAAGMKAMGVRSRDRRVPDGATFAHVARAMATLRESPLTNRLRDSTIPALIVVGENDFLGAGGSVILHRTLPGSELEIRAGRGHAVHLEDPEWFSSRVVEFARKRLMAAG
jgi:3-oxoadipate enol-lactonase